MIAATGQALVAVIREGADEVELPVVALQEDDEGYVRAEAAKYRMRTKGAA